MTRPIKKTQAKRKPARHATAIYLRPAKKPDLFIAWHGRKSSHHFSRRAAEATGAKRIDCYAKIESPKPDPRSEPVDAAGE